MIMIPMAVIMEAVMIVIKAISTPWPRLIRIREEDADRNANETQDALGGGEPLLLSVPECKHVRQSAGGNAIRPLIRPHFGFYPGFIFNSRTLNTHRLIF